jgi:hypothetical protein
MLRIKTTISCSHDGRVYPAGALLPESISETAHFLTEVRLGRFIPIFDQHVPVRIAFDGIRNPAAVTPLVLEGLVARGHTRPRGCSRQMATLVCRLAARGALKLEAVEAAPLASPAHAPPAPETPAPHAFQGRRRGSTAASTA